MTADEWDVAPRSDWMVPPLVEWARSQPDRLRLLDRKLWLFAVVCCRQRPELFADPVCAAAVDATDQAIEGLAEPEQLRRLYTEIAGLPCDDARTSAVHNVTMKLTRGGFAAALSVILDLALATGWDDFIPVTTAQPPFLRCIVGNPFRPVPFSASWRTTTAVALARRMYDARDFAALPILADALEDAGCDQPDILAHCRHPGPHARGCWVVDGVLGLG